MTMTGVGNAKRKARYKEYVKRQLNKGPRAVPTIWRWDLFEESGIVKAFTRSEARAQIKQRLGLKRLPKEVSIAAQA